MNVVAEGSTPTMLTVTAGNPSPEELAALVLVLAAAAGGEQQDAQNYNDWNRRMGVEGLGVMDNRGNWSGSLRRL